MIAVVCWTWNVGFRTYTPAHVNTLAAMIGRHLTLPHRVICITDEKEGFSDAVTVIPTPEEARPLGDLRTPEGNRFPSCYRRLWMFSEQAKMLGDRVMLLDVDLVVTRSLDPLFERKEEFVGWRPYRDWGNQCRFGGGLYLMTPGTRTKVWDDFKGAASIAEARAHGFRGSDQAWISYKLAATDPYFDRSSGVYSIRDLGDPRKLPADARLVQTNGPMKPWSAEGQTVPWIRENWR